MYELTLPRVIRIEPTNKCNCNCRHCPTGILGGGGDVLGSALFDSLLNQLYLQRDHVKVVVLYHGGEPLLNRQLPEMIERIKKMGISYVKTVTNGMLLNKEISMRLLLSGLDALEISLDGQTIYENDYIRRGSDAKKVIDLINMLINQKKQMGLSKPLIYLGSTQFDENNTPQYLEDAFCNALQEQEIESIKIVQAIPWVGMNVGDGFYIEKRAVRSGFLNYCDNAENTMTVRSNGDVVVCCYDITSKMLLGNALEDSLVDIWHGEKRKHFINTIRNGNPNEYCRNCNVICPDASFLRRHFATV